MSAFNYWKNEITYLKKVGPKRAEVLASECNVHTFGDLLHYFPRKYIDRSRLFSIREITGETPFVTLSGRVHSFHQIRPKNKPILTAQFSDGTGTIDLIWYQGIKYIKESLKENDELIIFGQPRFSKGTFQIAHPEMERKASDADPVHQLKILPYYSSSEKLKKAGLDAKGIRELMHLLLDGAQDSDFPENLPAEVRKKWELIPRKDALVQIHFPENEEKMESAVRRMKFEEFFFFQLMQARKKLVDQKSFKAKPFSVVGDFFNQFYKEHLPFDLTNAQKRVIKEIRIDLAKPVQMNRLVQGDVGSGKTMVAYLSCLIAADNGFQSAVMAPTEILAEQHFLNFRRYSENLGVRVALLTGSTKKSDRDGIFRDLLSGEIHILIGTHALIEPPVVFRKLGLTVVDEQHKFGVRQRAALFSKAGDFFPHNMVMTATPIPRTLGMTIYGDLDVSVIDELPPGRSPVVTAVRKESDRKLVLGFVKKEIDAGRQAYFVYPLIEESAKSDLLAAQEGFEALKRYYEKEDEYIIGIVHGRQKAEDKETEMQRFKKKDFKILVSTTVIEVGVDVPNATVMVIENAERFGLSQLHQLRGRVGRGGNQSYCILMVGNNKPSADAQRRLQAMVETTDGFRISEIDLEIRGPGDFLGTRQSGLPDFQLASVQLDREILEEAREAAFDLIASDPGLSRPEHAATKIYFHQFLKDSENLISVA